MNFSNKYLKLGAHIAFNDTANWQNWANEPPVNEWTPIGISDYFFETLFEGTFDGSGFTISGIYINSESNRKGLFAESNGIVKNLGVTASYVKGKSNIGGLAGRNNGEISKSYYVGDVVGYEKSDYSKSHNVGGIAGINRGTISNSYSAGTASGDWVVGGLVGDNTLSSVINNSYSTVKVTGREYYIGGLVGENASIDIANYTSGTVNNSYYNKETSGQNDKGKGDGKTTAEMKRKETFKSWDFDNVWKIDAEVNDGYPYLLNSIRP
jgi:hypothetical protein